MRPLLALAGLALLACPPPARAAVPAPRPLVVADFAAEPGASFPAGWKVRGDRASAERIYRVTSENGERFLRAVAQGDSVQIGLPLALRLADYPWLSWRWRVAVLPTGADERDAATNDSAAGVYVVFKGGLGGLLPRAIKYVWSAREPRGTALPSPRYPNARIVVLETGSAGGAAWRTELVNVADDYRRLFQAEPPEVQGVALLTDADDTRSRAVADYDQLRAFATAPADGADLARRDR